MSCHDPHDSLESVAHNGRRLKLRKLRKGTFSCLECKQRKKRCEFKTSSASACLACQRLNLPCTSPELEEDSSQGAVDVEKRISHVEGLVKQLVRQRNTNTPDGRATIPGLGTALDRRRGLAKAMYSPSLAISIREQFPASCLSLSGYLQTILPLPATAAVIITHGKSAFGWMWPQTTVNQHSNMPSWERAQPSGLSSIVAQPVILARKLVELALSMLQPAFAASELSDLDLPNEPFAITARRYANAAQQATSQDLLVRSVDGLETLLLEAVFQVHIGNLGASRSIFRRAIGIAQSMQLHRLPTTADNRVKYLWFRLAYASQWHALAYGEPSDIVHSGSQSLYAIQGEPIARTLDKMHIEIAGRIIERNVRLQKLRIIGTDNTCIGPEHDDLQIIDEYLKKAMRSVPTSWWSSAPTPISTNEEMKETTAKLQTQIHQSYLTILAHQPVVLSALHNSSQSAAGKPDTSHSKFACLSAARELLARFQHIVVFPHVPISLKGLEHKVYIAGSMALLIHLSERCGNDRNAFDHQRPHDINLIINMTRHIEDLYQLETDSRSATAMVFNKLANIEESAANGTSYRIWSHWSANKKDRTENASSNCEMSLSYPYFGRIDILSGPKEVEQNG